ncbi:MAG TPA: mechanosensitive ion channel domain-containing protein [Thermomicrobiales bacterium]|nr:mechanosensitive ion channel domain-containing protein [Thermomicrobiales bacterium]
MEVFGIEFVGVNVDNARKLLLSVVFVLLVLGLQGLLRWTLRGLYMRRPSRRLRFWTRQGVAIATVLLLTIGLLSIWFEQPARLAAALGIIGAGLAFALQKVVTALAGYFVILRGELFTVGDRITMGDVRGDVISVDFLTTHIFEMGQPPAEGQVPPTTWVRSRQPTGRIVSVSNARVFDDPIYNYSQGFEYIWEEISVPIPYTADRDRAERILLEAARERTGGLIEDASDTVARFARWHMAEHQPVEPKVYYRLTDNWLELTVRFIAPIRGVRDLKDEISRDILREFDVAGIELAPSRLEILGGLESRRGQRDGARL